MRHLFPILLLVMVPALGATPPVRGVVRLVDRIVAVVDEDPILLSDIRRVVGLGLVERESEESSAQFERRVLDGLIDQCLQRHEVERHDFGQLPPQEIERQLERIRAQFADEEALRQRLELLGLDDEGLNLLLARQLRVLVYVEQRLGPRVFINQDEIRTYYTGELATEMARLGRELPPLLEVRDQIREVLYEERLNQEIEAWTDELRLAADIVDNLDRGTTELPPIVDRLGTEP